MGVLALDGLLRRRGAVGAITGIGLAIVAAVIEFLWDGWRPHFAVLGRVEGMKSAQPLAWICNGLTDAEIRAELEAERFRRAA